MKQASSIITRWCLFSLVALSALWWVLAGTSNTRLSTPDGITRTSLPVDSNSAHGSKIEKPLSAESIEENSLSLDFSSANKSSLLLKTILQKSSTGREGELWFRDAQGVEWLVAKLVVHACFSPDGSKIAYSTADNEIFIETVSGERLTTIPNAREPVWHSDSNVVNFSAILSNEYPDVTQSASYDLNSGKITLAARDTTTSFPSLK